MKFGIILLAWLATCRSETIIVDTDLGQIKGLEMLTRLDAKFWSFRGIRYAKAPIGELRFLNPQPIESWQPDILDATMDGPMCPQRRYNETISMSEDCLRLNVYTKDLNGMKPVIVYLHPGGFYSFSAQSETLAGPEHFMDRDIVLVTVQYRLASLGFLATGTADAPGNAGLKDQVLALRWVQQHINKFGGDASSVTLWGYSVGSLSTGLHMLSSMSQNLFHRGIMMSCSPLGQLKYGHNQIELAEKQAKLLNCSDESIERMVNCLRTKPVEDYVNTMGDMFDYNWNPIINWFPVIEDDFGQERFLDDDPYKIMESGNFTKIPLITGITENEFYYAAYNTLRNETHRKRFQEDFNEMAPIYFMYERNTSRTLPITLAFRDKYLHNQTITFPESVEEFGQLYSDGVIGFGYYRFLQMASKHTPVYTYLFKYNGRYSFFRNPDTNQTHGAMHHDELLYLLHVPVITPLFRKDDPENIIIERLTRLWFEFAKKGNPNNSDDDYLKDLMWNLYNTDKKDYLEIGNELIMKQGGIYTDRYEFWESLFPLENVMNK